MGAYFFNYLRRTVVLEKLRPCSVTSACQASHIHKVSFCLGKPRPKAISSIFLRTTECKSNSKSPPCVKEGGPLAVGGLSIIRKTFAGRHKCPPLQRTQTKQKICRSVREEQAPPLQRTRLTKISAHSICGKALLV